MQLKEVKKYITGVIKKAISSDTEFFDAGELVLFVLELAENVELSTIPSILQSTLEHLLRETFSSFHDKVKRYDSVLMQEALEWLSKRLSFLLHVHLHVKICKDHTPMLTAFGDCWKSEVAQIVQIITTMQQETSSLDWSQCSVRIGLGKMVMEVSEVISRETKKSFTCEQVLSSLAQVDKDFPSALYHKYQELEAKEIVLSPQTVWHATQGVYLEKVSDDQGLVLKSVWFLMDALSTIATVAEGCGYQHLLDSTVQCALRLVNRSWQHIQQLSKRAFEDLPVKVCYICLSSLLYLQDQLETLLSPQRHQLQATLEEQATALQDRIVCYHCQLCSTCLFQDSNSADWHSSRAFYEGERCCYTVQMWTYHIRGLQHDLWIYLPLECRATIFLTILENSLSLLASCYSQTRPSPIRVPLFLADVLVVLVLVASLLPCVDPPCLTALTPLLEAVHTSCNVLVFMAGVVSCSLDQLHRALLQCNFGQGSVAQEWLAYVRRHGDCLSADQEVQCPVVALHAHPFHSGLLLRALLSEEGRLCVELCCGEGRSGVALQVLRVLAECPHTVWALAAVYTQIAERESECEMNQTCLCVCGSETNCSDLHYYQSFHCLLQDYLKPVLHSFLLKKAVGFHGKSPVGELCQILLDGLQEVLATNLPLPLLALLCVIGGKARHQSLGENLAKILAHLLKGCVLNPAHPCHDLLLPTHDLLCYVLDPESSSSAKNLNPAICQQANVHSPYLIKQRKSLGLLLASVVEPSEASKVDPRALARTELQECALEEHGLAARAIACSEEGLQSLKTIQSALWRHAGSQGSEFIPTREYGNMASPGGRERRLNQCKLMAAQDALDCIKLCTLAHITRDTLKIVRQVKWEWQEGMAPTLSPEEQSLMETINELVSSG